MPLITDHRHFPVDQNLICKTRDGGLEAFEDHGTKYFVKASGFEAIYLLVSFTSRVYLHYKTAEK